MPVITLPNGWKPRPYQRPVWEYLKSGGRHAELVWHRRSGKDEVGLHHTACAAHERIGTYWYMLPMANQARKAVWEAINPHTGKRRIDEAFPMALRDTTRENEMMIKFKVGSTWQVVGSDNFNALVGSPPIGIVYSEWALSNPRSRAYLRPIMVENGGWQMFNTTPRGNNHARRTFYAAQKTEGAFAELLTATDTQALSAEALAKELTAYKDDFGEDEGENMFQQEYMCSWDAALLGAYYGREIRRMTEEGRICAVDYDPHISVHCAWDLGYSDDTAIWFFQVIRGEVHILEYFASHGETLESYFNTLRDRPYRYGKQWLPHDAKAKTLASGGKSIEEQFRREFGSNNVMLVPELSIQDGIQATRRMLETAWIDAEKCEDGLECLRQYQREWDDDHKVFKKSPLHNWASHGSDAARYMAIACRAEKPNPAPRPADRFWPELTLDELWKQNAQQQSRRI